MGTYIFYASKDVTDGAWQDARNLLSSEHCVCLARGGLAIHKDSAVVPLKGCPGDRAHHRLVNLRGFAVGAEDIVKLEGLGLNGVLIPPSQLFLLYKRVDVERGIRGSSLCLDLLLDLIHHNGHGVSGATWGVRIHGGHPVFPVVDPPDLLVFVGG